MKIAWFCIPAHGHTNPTLGLVREVIEAGHEVYYFSFESFKEKIQGTGLSSSLATAVNLIWKTRKTATV